MHLSFIKSQGHSLIISVVFSYGVGSQVCMDSFFVTGVNPKAQNEEAFSIEKLFFFPLSGIPFSLQQKSGPQLYFDSELRSRRNQNFDGPARPLDPKMRLSRGGKKTNLLLHLARDEKERASSIDEQRIDGRSFWHCFVFLSFPISEFRSICSKFLRLYLTACRIKSSSTREIISYASSSLLCRRHSQCYGLWLMWIKNDEEDCGSPLAANAEGCRRKEWNAASLCWMRRIPSYKKLSLDQTFCGRRTRSIVEEKPADELRRRFFAFSSLGALMDTEHVRNTTLPLCWTAGANIVVSDQDQEPIRIWILTCRFFFTVGILPGSWWAHHELGRGGWWFRDPVENASFMPRVVARARLLSVILHLLHSWTSLRCCASGTFSIRSGLLAPVHSSATDDTRGRFLWQFFLLITGISMNLFYQMKQQASVLRISKK